MCADSFFASVEAATVLFNSHTRFIGVVKNATKTFPMRALAENEMAGRGDHRTMTADMDTASGDPFQIMAVSWIDRTRRYFISTAGVAALGPALECVRWREGDDGAYQKFVTVNIPAVAADYYGTDGMIDRHNRTRQEDLGLEKAFRVKDWSLRINSTLLEICVVDAYLLHEGGRGNRGFKCPKDFLLSLPPNLLATVLILLGFGGVVPPVALAPTEAQLWSAAVWVFIYHQPNGGAEIEKERREERGSKVVAWFEGARKRSYAVSAGIKANSNTLFVIPKEENRPASWSI